METNNRNIITALLLLLASQMVLFIALNFILPSPNNNFSIKKLDAVSKDAPLVLTGKWKLIK